VIFSGTPCRRDGALEEATRGGVVAVRAQQEVDRLAGLVDRAVKILPLASNLDVGRVHAPAQPDGALAPTKHQRQRQHRHRQHLDRPPVNRRVVDGDAALSHHLLKVAQAQQIRRIPAHALQHDFQRVVQSLDNLAQRVVHGLRRGFRHLLTIADTRYCNRTLVNVKRPEQGKMKDVAFIKDPDGYWIEIVEPARLKALGR